MDQTEQAIKDYIVREFMYDKPEQSLENDEPLIEGEILDSLGIFTLVAFLEKQFGAKLQASDLTLENFQTVNTIKRLVEARRRSNPSSIT
jgi:acyl carrier protein